MLAIPACSSRANLSLIPWLFQFILGIHELFDIWFVIGTSEFVSFSFFRLISKLFDSVLMFPHCFKGFLIYNFFSFNFFHLQKIWFLVMISSFLSSFISNTGSIYWILLWFRFLKDSRMPWMFPNTLRSSRGSLSFKILPILFNLLRPLLIAEFVFHFTCFI